MDFSTDSLATMNVAEEYAIAASVALIVSVGLFSPVFCALYLAMFKGRGVPGRWLFPLVGPAIAYGLVWVAGLILYLPFYLVAVFLVPALTSLGHKSPFWVPVIDWVLKYDFFVISAALIALSAWLVLHLWPRWPGVLAALANPAVNSDAPRASRSGRPLP